MTAIMQTGPTVRPVIRSDLTEWRSLWDGYNAFYGRSGSTALPEEVTRATWGRFFDETEPVHALVAELDGRLVGLAHYLLHRNTIMIAPTCYMQDLFTDPAARGSGIGRALLKAVSAHATDAGARSVYWHTHVTNDTAKALYDQMAVDTGFVVYRKAL